MEKVKEEIISNQPFSANAINKQFSISKRQVNKERASRLHIKCEIPDIKYGIDDDDIYIKLESVISEDFHIKVEDCGISVGACKGFAQGQYLMCAMCDSQSLHLKRFQHRLRCSIEKQLEPVISKELCSSNEVDEAFRGFPQDVLSNSQSLDLNSLNQLITCSVENLSMLNSNLTKHQSLHRNLRIQIQTRSSEKPLNCNICRKLVNKYKWKNHMKMHTEKNLFQCYVCNYQSALKANLRKHMVMHIREKPFKCDKCDYTSSRKSNLKSHLQTHKSDKPFKCNLCSYQSRWKAGLELHTPIHTGEKPFQCYVCNSKFIHKNQLRVHINLHIRDRCFECKICYYKFSSRVDFRRHVQTHSGEKPFQCIECNYKCIKKSDLQRHMLTHSGKKPFQCNVCNYECKRRYVLQQHIQRHTKKQKTTQCNISDNRCILKSPLQQQIRLDPEANLFVCAGCNYRFKSKANLQRHIVTQGGEKRFHCNMCDYKTTRTTHLRRHMKVHTQKKPPEL